MSKETIRSVKVVKTFEDFSAAALTNNIELVVLPERALVQEVIIHPTVVLAGGTIATATVSVGITGTATKYTTAKDIFTGSALVAAPSVTVANVVNSFTEDTSVKAFVTTTTGNLDAATTGSVEFYIFYTILA